MAGIPSGGQKLTTPYDVIAPAGKAGDKWGANGGDINPCNTITEAAALSNGLTQNNYQPDATQRSLGQQISGAAFDRRALDSTVAPGGSTQG